MIENVLQIWQAWLTKTIISESSTFRSSQELEKQFSFSPKQITWVAIPNFSLTFLKVKNFNGHSTARKQAKKWKYSQLYINHKTILSTTLLSLIFYLKWIYKKNLVSDYETQICPGCPIKKKDRVWFIFSVTNGCIQVPVHKQLLERALKTLKDIICHAISHPQAESYF